MNTEIIWNNFLEKIKERISPLSYDTWFKDTKLYKLDKNTAIIIVPMILHKKHLEENYLDEIEEIFNVEIKEYSGRKVFIVNPKEQNKSEQTILYIHGGAYMAEVTKDHWDFIKKIVEDTNATVIVPDYPLAPKYTYKEVFNMMEPLYKEIISKVDMEKFIVMGDSAGGGLALALEEKLSQEEIEMPEKTILISPWLDTRLTNPKIPEVQKRDRQLNKFKLQIAALGYAGKDGKANYLVNPIDGDLSKLKNITIFTGTNDILNPDVYVLKEKAEKSNIEINIKEYENAGHIWFIEKNSGEVLTNKGYQDCLETIKNQAE